MVKLSFAQQCTRWGALKTLVSGMAIGGTLVCASHIVVGTEKLVNEELQVRARTIVPVGRKGALLTIDESSVRSIILERHHRQLPGLVDLSGATFVMQYGTIQSLSMRYRSEVAVPGLKIDADLQRGVVHIYAAADGANQSRGLVHSVCRGGPAACDTWAACMGLTEYLPAARTTNKPRIVELDPSALKTVHERRHCVRPSEASRLYLYGAALATATLWSTLIQPRPNRFLWTDTFHGWDFSLPTTP